MPRFVRIVRRILFLIFVFSLALFLVFRIRYRDAVGDLARTQVQNITSDLINDAIDVQIESGEIQFERIVYFEKDLNGRITALKTNISEVNRLKTDILNLINDEILALGGRIYRLPPLNPIHPGYYRALLAFFRNHPEYRIVHCHLDCMSAIPLFFAKLTGIPIRIAHAHSADQETNWKYPIKRFFLKHCAVLSREYRVASDVSVCACSVMSDSL